MSCVGEVLSGGLGGLQEVLKQAWGRGRGGNGTVLGEVLKQAWGRGCSGKGTVLRIAIPLAFTAFPVLAACFGLSSGTLQQALKNNADRWLSGKFMHGRCGHCQQHFKASGDFFSPGCLQPAAPLHNTRLTRRVHLDCQYGVGDQKPYHIWFLGPNSIMALYLDPLGYMLRSTCSESRTIPIPSLKNEKDRKLKCSNYSYF